MSESRIDEQKLLAHLNSALPQFMSNLEQELNRKVEGTLENKIRGMLVDFRELQKDIEHFPDLFAAKIDDVNSAILETPGALEKSLEKLFQAAEEVENTTEKLLDDYKVTMRAHTLNEIDTVRARITEDISRSVNESLNDPLNDARAKTAEINAIISNGLKAEMSSRIAFGLGGLIGLALLSVIGCISSGLLYLQQQERAEAYYNAFRDQKAVLERLPDDVQRQFDDEKRKYFNIR